MSYLWNRDFSIQVGPKVLAARSDADPLKSKRMLRVTFRVDKSTSEEPNTAMVTVYNLSGNSRKLIQKRQPLVIEAGYTGTKQQIFSGDITFVHHQKEGANWVTYVETGDGADAIAAARIQKAFGANTPVYKFLLEVCRALGVGTGNSIQKLNPATTFRKGLKVFKGGVVASGKVNVILNRAMSSVGLQWSIQDGQLQILEPNEAALEEIVVLTQLTGLVGSPEVGEDGKIIVTSLLQGGIAPGRRLTVTAREVKGMFKIERVAHFGDTHSKDWYTQAEAKPL